MLKISEILSKKNKLKEKKERKIILEVEELKELGFEDIKMKFDTLGLQELSEYLEMDKEADKNMIYDKCLEPNLKDEELLKAFSCSLQDGKEPCDIIDELFSVATQTAICEAIISSSKLTSEKELVRIDSDIKKQ